MFFTVTLGDRTSQALVDHIDALRSAYGVVHARHPFETIAMVVMPDHLHAIWRLPPGDDRYSMRWRLIKTTFTARLVAAGVSIGSRTDGRRLWARRFWEHTIRDARDLATHVDYIHFNPVKHGHVAQVADWPYSTFHRAVARGEVARDWGGTHGASGAWGEQGR